MLHVLLIYLKIHSSQSSSSNLFKSSGSPYLNPMRKPSLGGSNSSQLFSSNNTKSPYSSQTTTTSSSLFNNSKFNAQESPAKKSLFASSTVQNSSGMNSGLFA